MFCHCNSGVRIVLFGFSTKHITVFEFSDKPCLLQLLQYMFSVTLSVSTSLNTMWIVLIKEPTFQFKHIWLNALNWNCILYIVIYEIVKNYLIK